jgi:hypothetical protein
METLNDMFAKYEARNTTEGMQCAKPAITYGSKTWGLQAQDQQRREIPQMGFMEVNIMICTGEQIRSGGI